MTRLLFLILIFLFCGAISYGEDYLAPQSQANLMEVLGSAVSNASDSKIVVKSNEYSISFIDAEDSRFGGNAILTNDKIIFGVKARTVDKDGKVIRSKNLSGKWMFKRFMEHFHGRFNAIQGTWIQSEGGNLSDNFTIFSDTASSNSRKKLEEAALSTWSGRMASSYGYSAVKIIKLDEIEPTEANYLSTDRYKRVEVLFKKLLKSRISHIISNVIFLSA